MGTLPPVQRGALPVTQRESRAGRLPQALSSLRGAGLGASRCPEAQKPIRYSESPVGVGEELPRLQRGHPGRASAPEPARGRSGPHRRPACHAGSSGLEGAARSRPQLRPGDKPEGRGQPDPRGPLGSAEAGVQMRSGAQGTATLASKGGGAQGGAQGRAQGKAQGRVRGSEGAALNPRPDRGRQPASPGEGRGRAGRRQSPGPGRGFWPASWTPQPTALGGAHASAPRRPRACWRRRRTPRTRALSARPLANEQFLLRMHKAVPASAFSRGVAWEPGAAGFASALRLRLSPSPPPRAAAW